MRFSLSLPQSLSTCPLALQIGKSESDSKLEVSDLHLLYQSPHPARVEDRRAGGAGDSRMEDQQEGTGQEHMQQPQSPVQIGLLLANIVPHLHAHVLEVRAVKTQH